MVKQHNTKYSTIATSQYLKIGLSKLMNKIRDCCELTLFKILAILISPLTTLNRAGNILNLKRLFMFVSAHVSYLTTSESCTKLTDQN